MHPREGWNVFKSHSKYTKPESQNSAKPTKKIGKACEQSKVYKRRYNIPKDIVSTLGLSFLIVIFLIRNEFEVFGWLNTKASSRLTFLLEQQLCFNNWLAALKCPCPGKIAHGKYSGSRVLGSKMTIHCDNGYKASGTATLNCVGGKWDALVPQCIGENIYMTEKKWSHRDI